MIYEIRLTSTRRPLGHYEGRDACEALSAMLIARGVSSGSGALLARVLDGLEAVPVDVLRARALERYADACAGDVCRDPGQRDVYAAQAGRQRGIAFRVAERA